MTRETIVDLIRHGEPEGGQMIRGQQIDHPLSALGWRQMWQAVGDTAPWDQVLSSPLARCREFAVALAARHGLPLAVDPELREIAMGAWEGLRRAELARDEPAAFEAFLRDPATHRPPGGERLEPFQTRIARAYRRQIDAYPGRRLLIVCHAGVSRAIVGELLGAAPLHWYRMHIDYAGLTRIHHNRYGASVEHMNARRLR